MRKGMGKGKGSGWKNLANDDSRRHGLASKGIKSAQKIPKRFMFENQNTLTEQQVNLIKRRLNGGKIKQTDVFGENYDKKYKITPIQTQKALRWLNNLRKTPFGKERLNNPFGYREEAVLDNFDRIELEEFYDNVNYTQSQAGIHNYTPLWRVIAKDGSSFEYYLDPTSRYRISIVG